MGAITGSVRPPSPVRDTELANYLRHREIDWNEAEIWALVSSVRFWDSKEQSYWVREEDVLKVLTAQTG